MCSSEWLRSQQLNWWENNKKIKWFLFRIRIMVLNASFNNISVIFLSRQSILLVEKTALPGENHIPVASHSQIIYCCIEYTSPWAGFELTTLVVIGTDCIGSCKSNYHMITTTVSPKRNYKDIINRAKDMRGEGSHPIIWLNPSTILCLSQTRTWIFKVICCGLFFVFSDLKGY